MKKLKLYLEQIENTVVMRVIQQKGITEDLSEKVKVFYGPDLQEECIFIRGKMEKTDHKTYCIIFDTIEEAQEYLPKVICWLDDVFVKPTEPKRGDLVQVWDTEDYMVKRIFLTKIEDSFCPFICVFDGYETEFKNGEKFTARPWKYMRQLTKTGYDPETKTYYGELNND